MSVYVLEMGNNKNFMSWYIMRVIIAIIDNIMISLTTAAKIVKIRWKHFTDVNVSEQKMLQ